MAGNIQVPNNIEDKTVLKRFLTDLVLGINGNSLFSGSIQEQNAALVEIIQNNPTLNFLDITSKLTELRKDILTYVEDNIETVILQNTEDISVIAEQFGTFYNQALAASWYGLSVKAGGAIAGLEVGSLDPNVVTPGDESSYFRIIANNFILGRAYEDLTQEEKNYLAANNLPNFGTVYNAQKQPIPALITSWDSASQVYKHYFNGIVQFSNIQNADYANAINNGTTTINGGKITTNTVEANVLKPSTGGTTVWSGGALISQNFNGNAVGNIGTPTQGFRLSSDAAGTSTDPNIFGAYIKGSTLEGVALSVNDIKVKAYSYPNNFGPIMLYDIDQHVLNNSITTYTYISPTFLGGGSGSVGYNQYRMCSDIQKFYIECTESTPGEQIWTSTVEVFVSVNNGTWQSLVSHTSNTVTTIAYEYTISGNNSVAFKIVASSNLWITGGIFKIQSINGQ